MNLKWSKTELGETIDTLKGCAFKSKDYVFDGVPVVRVSDFTENSIAEDKLVYLSEALAEEYSAYKLQHNNIVIQTVGSWQYNPASVVGKVIKIPKKLASSLLNQNAVKLIPNQNIDEKFLYYRLKDDTFKAHVLGSAQGVANQASITLTTIKRFKFFLPPLEVQQKIAAILSAYDDLIENNLNRIKLLEEMAQITYEEWFVGLKFPGHETTPIDSETGLPVGWSNTKLGNYIKFHKGKKLDEIFDNQVPNSSKILLLDSLENGVYKYALSKGHVKTIRGDLIMLMDGARSSWVFFAENGIVGSTISKITSEKIPLTLLYQFFKCHLEWLQVNNTGAAIPHANKQFINKINFKLASDDIFNLWRKTIDPTYQCIWNLKDQNQLLKEARDILLPRLMTGMIDVEQFVLPELFSNTSSSPEQEPQAA